MKLDNLIIVGLPKSFELMDVLDLLNPAEVKNPDDILYDELPVDCDYDNGEDASLMFKYNESASGVYALYNSNTNSLTLELPEFASSADVLLYADIINAVLKKHKRTRLFDKNAVLPGLTETDVLSMILDRKKYLKKLLTTKDSFVIEGVHTSFSLFVSHLKPAPTIDMQVDELQHMFVDMQWKKGDDE